MNDPSLPPLRQSSRALVIGLFVLVVAVPLVWKLARPESVNDAVLDTLMKLGAERIDRQLQPLELDLPLEQHDKKLVTLRELLAKGDTLVLHFWASWCEPCIQELPEIAELSQTLEKYKISVVSVSHDDAWQEADDALQRATGHALPKLGVWLREPEGQSGATNKMLRVRLGTEKLPETYVIQGDKILVRLIATQDWRNPRMVRALADLSAPRK